MRPRREIGRAAKAELREQLATVKSKAEYQRVQCVWLRAELGLSPEQIARATGFREGTVRQVQSRYLRQGGGALKGPGRGGRRNEYMTPPQETEFLERFVERARSGGVLVAAEVKVAFEAAVGHRVPKSTVYRLLARHGWRKIVPRPRHPSSDPAAAEDFKKNSSRVSQKSNAPRSPHGGG